MTGSLRLTMSRGMIILISLVVQVYGIGTKVKVEGLGNAIGLRETTSFSNRTIYAFRGIPYAEAPVGDLRFRPPVRVTTWKGDLDATKYGKICPQKPHTSTAAKFSDYDEDCLTLNVYVPELNETKYRALPVMVYLHGGSFLIGFAQLHEPHHLLEEDVILVVPQFRLGPLGLLCLHTDEIPGNVQFLDQIMAMKWVQDNIPYFGGDPGRVTLFGQSSGAASVNLHQFSPLSRGLFHQVILQSGSAFAPWVIDYNPLETAKNLGTFVHCEQTNKTELAACFKNLDVESILRGFIGYMSSYSEKGLTATGGNKAVIQIAGTQRFLVEDPQTLLARGEYSHMPMIGGAVKNDGSATFASLYLFHLRERLFNNTEYLKYNLISDIVSFFGELDHTGSITQTLTKMHFREEDIGDFSKMIPGLVDICSVFLFKAGTFRMLRANSRMNTSYLYTFGYFGPKSGWYVEEEWPYEAGVSHGDDVTYLFPTFDNLSMEDVAVAKRLVKFWTSFATTGKPVADDKTWEQMNTPFGPYLIIGEDLHNAANYLSEHTIALREGLSADYRNQVPAVNSSSV